MLSKFETKSNRVKGLSFHPKRPWILASLHNGSLQLWDYKMGTLIDRFDEHEGPVRGVAFHPTQPLFVSGGDDYKIKVWNWKQRRCLFTLNGHLDYIRTVFFHHELPWIISCADDQTIRIWNWQSRNCINILTGHNHYVMCAQFHPKDDLIVSASLDQTVRVWDYSGLKKKHASPAGGQGFEAHSHPALSSSLGDHRGPNGQADLFGNTDVVVKYVLEGHDRGVNWVSFHPSLPLIVSGADDRQVKLWRMNETKAWEVDTCRGHYNNVSSAIFHPRQDLILSNSEDKTIRIWDMTKRTALQTFRREHDRFWILSAHPELNLFAAGHDNGLIVFKLERERPAATVHNNQLFYVKDKFVRMFDFEQGSDVPVVSIRRTSGSNAAIRTLSYNPAEHAVLLSTTTEGGTYEMYALPRDMRGGEPREGDAKRGQGNSAIFVARNRFAVLDKQSQQITIRDLKNEITKQFKTPPNITEMFYAGTKNILLVTATSAILYDTELRANVNEISATGIRYAIWSPDMSMVALLSKHFIIIANRKLEQLSQIHETIKIKSGAWDELGIFVYTTLNHIKYALPQGDNGIIKTLDQPVYLHRIMNKSLFCLDREAKLRTIPFDPTEYRFKLALVRRNYDEVINIIRTSNLVGQSIIAYLEKKGYPEVALQFVKDPKTRFELALKCGNLEVAMETAKTLDKEEGWIRLGEEALKQGNHQVLEMTYQRVKNFDRLSMLYLITGNTDKLKKMMKIAEMRNDPTSRYHNALYLGDIDEQIKVLKETGQYQLAYLAAHTHGLEEEAAAILELAGVENVPSLPLRGDLLRPPTPILRHFNFNWPLEIKAKSPQKGMFAASNGKAHTSPAEKAPASLGAAAAAAAAAPVSNDWGEEDVFEVPEEQFKGTNGHAASGLTMDDTNIDLGSADGWDIEGDLDIPAEDLAEVNASVADDKAFFIAPTSGTSMNEVWCRNSGLASDHAAAGNFETAMQLLNRQVGAVNFTVLKPLFLAAWQASHAYLKCNASLPSLSIPIHRHWDEDQKKLLPAKSLNLSKLISLLQEAYAVTTTAKFNEALQLFKTILHSILFIIVESQGELDEVLQLQTVCREYIQGLGMEIARRDVGDSDMKRAAELAVYFTHCQLQPAHLQLSLRSAMTVLYKLKNYATASLMARRLLEQSPPPQVAETAKKVLKLCERTPNDEAPIEYDQYNPFVVCASSFTPIYRGSPSVECPFCKATFLPRYSGSLCTVCEISVVGTTGTGLRCMKEF